MNLAAHGSYSIKQEGSILIIDAHGPFNEKITEQYQHDITDVMNVLSGSPWASLVTYHGNGIFTPEAEKQIVEITKLRMKHNMVANASVIIDSVHADLQQMQLRRIYNACNLTFHVFSDIRSARNWLEGYLVEQRAAM